MLPKTVLRRFDWMLSPTKARGATATRASTVDAGPIGLIVHGVLARSSLGVR